MKPGTTNPVTCLSDLHSQLEVCPRLTSFHINHGRAIREYSVVHTDDSLDLAPASDKHGVAEDIGLDVPGLHGQQRRVRDDEEVRVLDALLTVMLHGEGGGFLLEAADVALVLDDDLLILGAAFRALETEVLGGFRYVLRTYIELGDVDVVEEWTCGAQ